MEDLEMFLNIMIYKQNNLLLVNTLKKMLIKNFKL